MSETRSHHVRTRCRIHGCEAVVYDIRRHLLVHVKQGQLHPEDVDSHAEVMRHGKRKHVVSKSNPEVRGTAKKQKRRKKVVSSPRLHDGVRQTRQTSHSKTQD